MTETTMTIYDPAGVAYELEWYPDLDFDAENWCALCEETITDGWVDDRTDDGSGALIVCDTCARANATTEGR